MGKLLPIPLDESRRSKLRKRAAEMTLATGEQYNMTKLILEAVDAALAGGIDESTSAEASEAKGSIKFNPQPEVFKAIKRAQINSGQDTSAVINALLTEALQLEGVPA